MKVPLLTRKFTFLLIGIVPKNRRYYLSDPGKLASRPLQRFCHRLVNSIMRDNRGSKAQERHYAEDPSYLLVSTILILEGDKITTAKQAP